MEVDWDKRRRNLRILLAVKGLRPSPLADSVGLSANTLSSFLNGTKPRISHDSIVLILPALGLTTVSDLDADNVLDDPRVTVRRLIEQIPDADLPRIVEEFARRYPGPTEE